MMISASAAAGAAAGLLATPRRPKSGCLTGAFAGLAAGTLAAVICRQREAVVMDRFGYYSDSSSLYEEDNEASYI